jgi:SAM-dependent methyltransferase
VTSPARERALAALAHLSPEESLAAVSRRLSGDGGGILARLPAGSERRPSLQRIDGSLLEAVCARSLRGARGAVFTPPREAHVLAAFGLAHAARRRGGPPPAAAVASLLAGRRDAGLARALEGMAVLDPACGAGALLAAAEALSRRQGARLALRGLDVAPLAAEAARARLRLLGARAEVLSGDALAAQWAAADLVLANPPFLRHEALGAAEKERAARASGLPRQADLSAHFAAVAIRRAPVAALVWPRALDVSRSAEPLLADARARGGFVLRLRSRAAGSFAASVDTRLAVWVEGAAEAPEAEASVPLADLADREIAALAGGSGGGRIRLARSPPGRPAAGAEAVPLSEVCDVRFGTKTGCNAFFHLRRSGPGAYASALAGEIRLEAHDVVPLLASLKEARAPERAEPARVLFRPERAPGEAALRYVALGEAAGVHARPTCAARSPWWRLVPGRGAAPLLYPAKIGARAFAFLNREGLWEDKKWHALFPRGVPAWQLALALSSTPVRLAIDEGARQLTGAQAIADVDCRILAAAPVPAAGALAGAAAALAELRRALARDPVTTDLAAMLARPAQRELDLLVGRLLGLGRGAVDRSRRALLARVEARLAHGAAVREALAGRPGGPGPRPGRS